ncbi:MAG: VCBS repeat-containing protein [Planctomycetes bacterium]|nr:VCBS repeat-containing protein [Planctomycetota bacterium]
MSHAPTKEVSLAKDDPYLTQWAAMGKMIRRGRSLSGRERNCCFLNTGGRQFADVSAVTGLDLIDDGRGVAIVDWDHDGDLDVWLGSRTGPRVRLMRNNLDTKNRFVTFKLQGNGVTCNRDAIGARLEIHLASEGGAEGANRKLIKTLRAGEGFVSQSSKWVHFARPRLPSSWPNSTPAPQNIENRRRSTPWPPLTPRPGSSIGRS